MDTNIISSLIDLERYPVDDLGSDQGKALIASLQESLESVGSASMPGFLLPDALEAMAAEAQSLVHLAYLGPTRVSPYFFNYDIAGADVPDDHPTRFLGTRNVSQVAYDLIPRESLLCRLYHSDVVTNLVARVRNKDRLYRLADRYQSLNISVMREGGHQQWHFDQGRLVTTLLMQAAEKGGVFEYVPDIRSDEDEHFNEVAKVLAGDHSKVRQLDLIPGSLNLFLGHYSMHRVTPVEGRRNRLQTIFAFADEPDTQGSLKSSILHYGPRVAALQEAQA
tara:strand:+ start:1151 stop:1987 length:837 start_codon:yes stop_codon:yes gene_type:complete